MVSLLLGPLPGEAELTRQFRSLDRLCNHLLAHEHAFLCFYDCMHQVAALSPQCATEFTLSRCSLLGPELCQPCLAAEFKSRS